MAVRPSRLTPLQRRLASGIVAHARRENLPAGANLPEQALAARLGTSRSPVRATLAHLATTGIVRYKRDHGWFLAKPASALARFARASLSAAEDPLYDALVERRLGGGLRGAVTESELMRRFKASRSALRRVLLRIQQQGWAERRPGHGWLFLPLIDTAAAYEECHAFRAVIEPAGILTSTYRPELAELESCRNQQQLIVDGGYRTMTPVELFETNAHFHETLAGWSGNRFILQAIQRLNCLRRLVEYRQAVKDRAARRLRAREHLAILERIAGGDFLGAASLMRDHLNLSFRQKVAGADFPPPPAGR